MKQDRLRAALPGVCRQCDLSLIKRTTSECGVDGCLAQTVFKVHGRVITERAVEPRAVGRRLRCTRRFRFRLGARGEDPILDEFAFERGPEALHFGVVVAVGRPAHARDDLMTALAVHDRYRWHTGCRGPSGGATRARAAAWATARSKARATRAVGIVSSAAPAHDLAAVRVEHAGPRRANPLGWRRRLMSVCHTSPGARAVAARPWRLGAMGHRWRLSVVRGRKRRFCVARRRCARMSRATRCRPARFPGPAQDHGQPGAAVSASARLGNTSLIFAPRRAFSLARVARPSFARRSSRCDSRPARGKAP